MIQLAWRFLLHQKGSALARWYRARTADARAGTRKTLIVALAGKLLVGLWRLVTTGEVPEGVVLRPAARGGGTERTTIEGIRRSSTPSWRAAGDGPRWRQPERKCGRRAAVRNGPAAPELRRRCAWLHHGPGLARPAAYKLAARWPAPPSASSPPTATPSPFSRAGLDVRSGWSGGDECLTRGTPYKLAPGPARPAVPLLVPLAGAAEPEMPYGAGLPP